MKIMNLKWFKDESIRDTYTLKDEENQEYAYITYSSTLSMWVINLMLIDFTRIACKECKELRDLEEVKFLTILYLFDDIKSKMEKCQKYKDTITNAIINSLSIGGTNNECEKTNY